MVSVPFDFWLFAGFVLIGLGLLLASWIVARRGLSGLVAGRQGGRVADVSERQRAEEELRRSEQRFQAVVDALQEMVFRWLPDGTRTFVNPALCRFLDRTEDELLGTCLFDELKLADRVRVKHNVRRLTPADPMILSEVEVPDRDGRPRWVEWSDKGIFDRHGKLVEVQSVGRDVTARARVQQDLEHTRSLLFAAVEASPAGIIIADAPDGRVRVANRAVMDILGADADNIQEVVERVRRDGYYGQDGRRFERGDLPVQRALTEGVTTRPVEMRMRGADGRDRWIANSGAPVRNAAGEVIAAIAVATDITDIKRTQLAIRGVVASVSAVTGKKFCEVLVLELSKVLGAEIGLIVQRAEGEDRNQILALAMDGEITGLYPEYDARGSPSGEVMRRGRCMAWDEVQRHFPDDSTLAEHDVNGYVGVPLLARDARTLGMLAVMSRKPLKGVRFKTEILELFAVRAAAELEREHTALALVQSEERFRTAFEEAPIGTVILDRDGCLRRVNKSFCRILRRSPAELTALCLGDLVHPGEADSWVERLLDAADPTGEAGQGCLRRADGSEIWVNYSAQSMPDPSGETLYLVMIEDTTARKRAERELQVSRDLQGIIAEVSASFAGATGTEVDAQIDQVLARVGEFLGIDRITFYWIDGEIATLNHYWHRDGAAPPPRRLSLATQVPFVGRAIIEGRVVNLQDVAEYTRDRDSEREVFAHFGTRSLLAVPVKVAGSPVGACTLATTREKRAWPPDLVQWTRVFGDMLAGVTARKAAEERQDASRRQLRALAHELTRAEDEERRRCAIYLHDQIGQTLALMRMKLGEQLRPGSARERRESVTQLRALIENAIDDAQTLTFDLSPPVLYELGLVAAIEWVGEKICEENGIAFSLEVADAEVRPPRIAQSSSILFRAVRELLVNVVKHGAASSVRIRVVQTAAGIQITVRDDGVGFDTTTLSAGRGTNRFGLFSIRERLDFIGGEFTISSSAGQGTRASLFVPAESSAPVGEQGGR